MSKKNKQPELSGLLVVDKPLGVTSHDVVAAVRGELHMRRVGHAGTLDPQASGVLVIGFGHGTRLLNYIVDHTKTYEATIRLGQASTTDDSEGDIMTVAPVKLADDSRNETVQAIPAESDDDATDSGVNMHRESNIVAVSDGGRDADGSLSKTSSDIEKADDLLQVFDGGTSCADGHDKIRILTLQQIKQAINEHLTGDIEQVPSSYSAVRVNGRHAYELARQGKAVELAARPVTISEFTVLGARNAEAETDGLPAGDIEDEPNQKAAGRTPVVDVDVRISCSTGTYIRSLGRDLGQLLGVGGYLTRLRRTRVGRFDLTAPQLAQRVVTAHAKPHTFTNREGLTLTLNKAVLDVDAEELKRRSLTMLEAAQRTMPTVPITDADARNLRFGRRLPMPMADNADSNTLSGADSCAQNDRSNETNTIAAVFLPQTGEIVGIVEPANAHELKSVVVFPPTV
ncbi:tRNA pseudouridine(55) synthase TruB [Bifidobacterium sp. ESL0800]|uniref:tRNA pseudouridine synthase B n=1 Tax=Bifidobacterium sp. ESL0800 TaxID=2983236 RepID=UPI0023F882C3|nr:tRNA pseudouridine(55) synthase TruB [Bifidobacterium sp. ESL0800]WEV75758.1 tRNA pseudouridine(55) synthase TruB [Bifidobacterium sp. ESL0800]